MVGEGGAAALGRMMLQAVVLHLGHGRDGDVVEGDGGGGSSGGMVRVGVRWGGARWVGRP